MYRFNVCHPEVFNTYINIKWCVSHTQQNFIMFIIVLGQHVSILTESSSGPSKKVDPYLKCLKMCWGTIIYIYVCVCVCVFVCVCVKHFAMANIKKVSMPFDYSNRNIIVCIQPLLDIWFIFVVWGAVRYYRLPLTLLRTKKSCMRSDVYVVPWCPL